MSEEEILNTEVYEETPVEEVVEEAVALEDPAEQNVCDSCQ